MALARMRSVVLDCPDPRSLAEFYQGVLGGDVDAHTRAVIHRVQADGEAWMGGTTWQGKGAMRISVSNWSTTEADIDRTAATILRCAADA